MRATARISRNGAEFAGVNVVALCGISHGRATLVRPGRMASGEAWAHDGHCSVAMLKA